MIIIETIVGIMIILIAIMTLSTETQQLSKAMTIIHTRHQEIQTAVNTIDTIKAGQSPQLTQLISTSLPPNLIHYKIIFSDGQFIDYIQ